MSSQPDLSTVELTRTRVRIREDVRFVPQMYAGRPFWHLEVRTSSEYFRIGHAEYVFVSLLDGKTTFAEALAVTAQQLKESALSQSQAMTLYQWLIDNGLAVLEESATTSAHNSNTAGQRGRSESLSSRLNPFWIRIPLGRPDALLQTLSPLVGWLFSGAMGIFAVLIWGIAGIILSAHWTRFAAASANVISRDNWLWLLTAWLFLKLLHELAHGIVCHRYGGTVRQTGIVLAFLTPLVYVDASSCWSFRSRWQRIHTALAGVYTELTLAAIAVIVWVQSDSALVRHLLYNVIAMASVSTVLFNLNPLMKFDGYYVLSDLLQIPNLSSRAGDAVSAFLRRILCGESDHAPEETGSRRLLLLTYGFSAVIWRFLVSLSLLIMASVLCHGAGVVLTAAGVIAWYGQPLTGLLKGIRQLWRERPERLIRAGLCCSFAAAMLTAGLMWLPAPVLSTAPGIVEFVNGDPVRAETPGFVEAVHVTDGQFVNEGDLLVTLRNDDVQSRYDSLKCEIAREELRLQTATHDHDAGALSVSQGNLHSLRQQYRECRNQVEGLQIRSRRAGQVLARGLHQRRGTFAAAGAELLLIGLDHQKEVRLSVGQRRHSLSETLIGKPVSVRVGTHGRETGTLVKVNPRASRSIPHPALAAVNGGPLPVSETPGEDPRGSEKLRLTEQRFAAVVRLPDEKAALYRSGERATVCLGLPSGSLGTHIWYSAHDWFERQLQR